MTATGPPAQSQAEETAAYKTMCPNGKESSLIPNWRSENLADVFTECFSLQLSENTFRQNVGNVFRSQSWYERALFFIFAGAN